MFQLKYPSEQKARQVSPVSIEHAVLVAAVGLILLLAFLLPRAVYLPERVQQGGGSAATLTPIGDAWLRIEGSDLIYRGQKVQLRGANFSNVPALGASIGSGNPADVQITAEDYLELRKMGGNHARFGLSFRWYKDHRAAFWSMLDAQVGYAREAKVWLIPVMFTTPGDCYEGYGNTCPFWTSQDEQQQLKDFWIELVKRYQHEPTLVGIDLLNEPTPPNGESNVFWEYATTLRDAVIAANPNLVVLIMAGSDPTFWRTLGTNVIYEVHDYTPLQLTHGSASWTEIKCDTGVSYPGTMSDQGRDVHYDKNAFANSSDYRTNTRQFYSINWATNNKVPIYIGEWGSQSACEGWDQFLRDKASLYNQWEVNWAFYAWRSNPGNFGVFAQQGALKVQNVISYQILKTAFSGTVQP